MLIVSGLNCLFESLKRYFRHKRGGGEQSVVAPRQSRGETRREAGTTAFSFRPLKTRSILYLCSIATALSACTSDSDEGSTGSGEARAAEVYSFTEITEGAGLASFKHETGAFGDKLLPETMGSGVAFIDYNNNGWPDILAATGGFLDPGHLRQDWPAVRLYENNGDGTFSERTTEAGLLNTSAYGFGITVADYNNSGWQDFYLTALEENLLFRNENGVFTEVGAEAGVHGSPVWSTAALFFDANNNGLPDLYVGNYVEWSPEEDIWCSLDGQSKSYCTPLLYQGIGAKFYLNNGDGTFRDETDRAGFSGHPGKTLGVAELDLGNNGYADLVVANDTERDLLFRNNGDGTFSEVGVRSGIAYDAHGRARAGMGIDTGYTGEDDRSAVFVGNFAAETIGVYFERSDGLFEESAGRSGIGRPSLPSLTFGLFLADLNLNGKQDLWVVNGHIQEEIEQFQDGITYRQSPQLFENEGEGSFRLHNGDAGGILSEPIIGRGAAYADITRNGRLDIVMTENGGGLRLWRNDSNPDARFLRVRVHGRENIRDGLGTSVVAYVNNEPMIRRIRTGSSYLSQSELVATFGLGFSNVVDSLVVQWANGYERTFTQIPADRQLYVHPEADDLGLDWVKSEIIP